MPPLLIDLFALLLDILIGCLGVQANRHLGLQAEARYREALHSALMSGVLRAVELRWDRDAMADEALASYARRRVPDAVRAALRIAFCRSWPRRRCVRPWPAPAGRPALI